MDPNAPIDFPHSAEYKCLLLSRACRPRGSHKAYGHSFKGTAWIPWQPAWQSLWLSSLNMHHKLPKESVLPPLKSWESYTNEQTGLDKTKCQVRIQLQAHLFVLLWDKKFKENKSLQVHGGKQKPWTGKGHNHTLYCELAVIIFHTSCSSYELALLQKLGRSRSVTQWVNPHLACMESGGSLPSAP